MAKRPNRLRRLLTTRDFAGEESERYAASVDLFLLNSWRPILRSRTRLGIAAVLAALALWALSPPGSPDCRQVITLDPMLPMGVYVVVGPPKAVFVERDDIEPGDRLELCGVKLRVPQAAFATMAR